MLVRTPFGEQVRSMTSRVFVGAAPVSARTPADQVGGLYRSENGGDWDTLTNGLPVAPWVRAVAIHPLQTDVVFAGTQDGPYRSTDGGTNWQKCAFPVEGAAVWSIVFDPTDPTRLYAGTEPAQVFRSSDSGLTWEVLPGAVQPERLDMGFPTRLIDLAVDPNRPSTIFAGVEVGGVMRSDDAGETWVDCSASLVELADQPRLRSRIGSETEIEGMLDTHALAMSPGQPGVTFLAVRMGVFRTKDGGQSWHDINIGRFSPLTYCRDVIASAAEPRVMYACLSDEALGKAGSLWRSDDDGETWGRFDAFTCTSTLMQVAAHRQDPKQVWCATRHGQVFGTLDGGETWLERPLPSGGRDVYAIACG